MQEYANKSDSNEMDHFYKNKNYYNLEKLGSFYFISKNK